MVSARLKLNYNKTKYSGPAAATQYIFCPFGGPQTGIFGQFDDTDRVYTELRLSF